MTIGIVVPTLGDRDRLDLLAQAVASVRAQRGVVVEVVVVTVDEARTAVAAALPGERVIVQKARGIASAISDGWASMARATDYLGWLGDDDLLAADALLSAANQLRADPKTAMVFGRCRYVDLAGCELREIRPGRLSVILLRLGTNLIGQPGALYRRSAVERVGGLDPDIKLAFDVDLHVKLAYAGRVRYLPQVLGMARVHPSSLTTRERSRSQAEAAFVTTRALGPVASRTEVVWGRGAHVLGRVAYKFSSRVPAAS
jgi:GT2 family glycosyltransferase